MTTLPCGWPGDHSTRPHCDGVGRYVDTWDGRIVHILRTGHRPVPTRAPATRDIPPQTHDERRAHALATLAADIGPEQAAKNLGMDRQVAAKLWDLAHERWEW